MQKVDILALLLRRLHAARDSAQYALRKRQLYAYLYGARLRTLHLMAQQDSAVGGLENEFGVRFWGNAETASGDIWWWTDSHGIRHPLLPCEPKAERPLHIVLKKKRKK